jgi:putative PEP-CTERM system TPR-repeat lipoprotein
LLQLNRANEAIPILQGILEKTPAQTDALTLLSQALLAQNRGQDAADAAERARKAEPNNLGIVSGEAQIYARMKDYDRALQVLNSAKVNGKTPVQLLPTLGSVQLAAGQNDAAKGTFADLVAAEPNNVGAILAQIEVLSRLKDYDTARQVLNDALQRQPGNLPLLQARVRVELLDKGLDAALRTAEMLRNTPANMPAAATLKGGLLVGAQRFKDAAAAFAEEYRKEPSSALVVALAQAMQAAGDANGATAELQRWQADHPDDPAVAQAIGTIDLAAGRYDSAERNLQIVLKQRPNDLVALNNIAWLFQKRGDKRAREYAQRAFEQSPTPEVSDTLAWIMVSQGDSAKALPLLQAAVAGRPNNPSIRYHLAVALKDANRPEEAISVLRPVVSDSVTFDEKPSAQSLLSELVKAKP